MKNRFITSGPELAYVCSPRLLTVDTIHPQAIRAHASKFAYGQLWRWLPTLELLAVTVFEISSFLSKIAKGNNSKS